MRSWWHRTMPRIIEPLGVVTCLMILLLAGPTRADRLELVRYTHLWEDSPVRSSDASGITYLPGRGQLLIVDSEISEYGDAVDPASGQLIFEGNNAFESPLDLSARTAAYLAAPPNTDQREPVGIVYNPADGHVYVVDDDRKRIYRYPFGSDGHFGKPVATALTSFDDRYSDPEGITLDPKTGEIFVASGTKKERVLVFRFDAVADTFTFLRDFPIHEQIADPEGIGLDPVTGHLFLVGKKGIAEFRRDGHFVQFFGFGFLKGTGVTFTLPGGLTFAPSSDPNDPAETHSLYVTCRGIDNGAFPDRNTLDGGVAELRLLRTRSIDRALRVPADHATIQAAVDAAADGDTILVSPGLYLGPVDLGDKRIALLSQHYLSDDLKDRQGTAIDGDGGKFAVRIGTVPDSADESDGPAGTLERDRAAATQSDQHLETTAESRSPIGSRPHTESGSEQQPPLLRPLIWGFTIRNADDGITAYAPFDLIHSRVTETSDGIDYEAGGGSVRFCLFHHNRDDAIDLDGSTAALIEHCELVDNGDDGVEIRLHPHAGPDTLDIVIRDNLIARNGEDGIQLIGYDEETARRFHFQGNRIISNAMAGIGMMPSANTREDYTGAPLPEAMVIANNTFVDNEQHLVGGARVLMVNNIFTGSRTAAIHRVGGASVISHNLIRQGGDEDSGLDTELFHAGSQTIPRFSLVPSSPAIDGGLDHVMWQGRRLQLVEPSEMLGEAPDLGALEYVAKPMDHGRDPKQRD